MATAATGNAAVGTVKIVIGDVKIVGIDGVARQAHVGDKVFAKEVLQTAANAIVQVQLENGHMLDMGRNSQLALDDDILSAGAGGSPAVVNPQASPAGDIAALQAQIASGADPSKVAEASAAGGAPAAGGGPGDGSGSTPVIVDQANSLGQVTSGFGTGPASIGFPTIPPGLLPVVENTPVVNVSVAVGIGIGTGGEGGGGVSVLPPGTPIPVLGVTAIDIPEGTSSGTHPVSFLITLSEVSTTDVTITYTIVPGSASNPGDFFDGSLTGTVTIPAGSPGFIVTELIVEDHLVEGNESFKIVLSNPVGATLVNDTATVTIVDDDAPPVAVDDTNWAKEDVVNASGNVLQNVSHSGAPSGTFADKMDTDSNPTETITVTGVNGSAANVGAVIVGTYGTLVLNTDGSYTYTLNNANAEIQALAEGQTRTESFTYTITDGYNPQPTPATLTITIFGTNDGPILGRGEVAVSEEGLEPGIPDNVGSNDTTNNAFGSGSISITDPDGNPLTVTLSAPSDALTSGGQTIDWSLSPDGKTLTGSISNGESTTTIITVTINNTGDYQVQLYGPIDHPTVGVEDQVSFNVGVNVTDGTNNAATTLAVTVEDDSPVINVATNVSLPVPTLTVDETTLGTDASASFAGQFSSAFGADGAGQVTYTLGTAGGASGLVDTATGEAVNLVMNGLVVEGRTVTTNQLVFTVSVDASGTVTLDQIRAVVHPTNDPNESTTLNAANLVTLTATVTDNDGDSANATLNIGQNLSFLDDGPSINANGASAPVLTVDETVLATDASASFADQFSGSFGADGAGTIGGYALGINAGSTGLVDSATGDAVVLSVEGGQVVGRAGAAGPIVFTVSVDASGTVTLDQQRAVMHTPDSGANQSTTLSAANLVTLTATITDKDGDTANATLNIGQNLTFLDDGPDINTTGATIPTLTVDETNFAVDASASFAGMFTTVHNSTDGGNTVTYGLNAVAGPSGLVDTLTGNAVVLSVEGGQVVGRAGVAGPIVFTVSVDTNGVITLNESRAVMHTPDSGPNQSTTLSAANLVTLTATITDTDNDTDTATINIGQSLSFLDDGPSISATNVAVANIAGTYTGTYSFNVGADAQAFADSFASDALVWTNPRPGYALEYDAGASTATAHVYHGTFNGGADTFFTLTLKADGTYDITLVTPDPVTEVDVASILSGIAGGSNLPSYTIDSSVFGGEFSVLLTGYTTGHAADTITISSTELGVGDNVMHGNKDDALRFDIQPVGGSDAKVSELTIHVATTAGWKSTDTVEYIVHYTTGSDTNSSEVWGADREVTLHFDTTRTVDWVEITPNGTEAFKIDGVSLSYITKQFPDDYNLNFQVTGDDKDGDTATTNFTVAVNTTDTTTFHIDGTSGADHVYGTTGNDILVGGAGSDTLDGGAGADAFTWMNADKGTVGAPAIDTVIGFTENAGDKLDLADLLQGEHANAASLANFLHFTSSSGNTTIDVKSTGAGAGPDQQIVLQGVDLTAGGTLNDSQIITNLLTQGKLHTDA